MRYLWMYMPGAKINGLIELPYMAEYLQNHTVMHRINRVVVIPDWVPLSRTRW